MVRKMKPSGIAWIGDIPNNWDVRRFKRLFSIIGGNGFSEHLQGQTEGDFPFCKCSDINGQQKEVSTASNYVSEAIANENRFNIIPTNSILIAKIGESLKKNHRKINSVPCIIDNNMEAFVTSTKNNIIYYYYVMTCVDMMWFDNNGTIPSVNNEKLRYFSVPFPSFPEQNKIVDYLNEEIDQIDTIIETKRKQIELLKEYRRSVITEAVTRGLNPKSPMQQTSIHWLGSIPVRWELKKFKYIANFSKGLTITKVDLVEEGIPVVNYGEIHSKFGFRLNPKIDKLKCVPEQHRDKHPYAILKKGDFIFADTSEDYEGSGNFTHLDSDVETMAGYHTIIARLKTLLDNDYRFIAYWIDSEPFRLSIRSKVSGVKVFSISQSILKNAPIVLPSKEEQEAIADYLDKKTAEIDSSIAIKEQIITKLAKYKKSLIYEVVTGKKEVA